MATLVEDRERTSNMAIRDVTKEEIIHMKYQPITCVWEVTMGCNMRCGHCGSSCAEPLKDELNTEDALDLCDQIAALGLKWITISGGEPLTRKDLPKLINRLSRQGVSVNIITNGWLLDEDVARKLKKNGIATAAISIDGTKEIHDKIRKKGAFEHASKAFANLKAVGIKTGAVTTLTKQNIGILSELKEDLIGLGVDSWQVQLGLPMGNLKEKQDWVLEPEQVNEIIDFCYDTAKEGRIKIYPADCIGYYTKKELEIKKISYGTDFVSIWDGCNAGIRGFGILQNGDILGCTSIRDKKYIEGNVTKRSLRDIWEGENSFSWRRNMTAAQLSSSCRECVYSSKCLGGCPNTRLTMNGTIESENKYCAYNLELKKMKSKYAEITDSEGLYQLAEELIKSGEYQEAAFALEQVVRLSPDDMRACKAKGYADYMCGNYKSCKEDNAKVLEGNPNDAYALKGYGIAVHRLGNKEEGLRYLRRAVELTGYTDRDMLEDLRIMECE